MCGQVGDDRIGRLDGDLDDRARDYPIAGQASFIHRTKESCSRMESLAEVAGHKSRIDYSAVDA